MKITVTRSTHFLVVTPGVDRLDAGSAIAFKREMRRIVDPSSLNVLLNLSQVTFLDSSGLEAIIAIAKSLEPLRAMEISNLQPLVQHVFDLTNLSQVFRIHADADTLTKVAS